jgi:hypothetical protein
MLSMILFVKDWPALPKEQKARRTSEPGIDSVGVIQISFPCLESNPHRPAIPTEIFRLFYYYL